MPPELLSVDFQSVGTTVVIAALALGLINLLKASAIPIEIPARFRALAAAALTAVTVIATLHVMGYPLKVAIIMGLFGGPIPSGVHELVSKPAPKTVVPTPVEVVNQPPATSTTIVVRPEDAPAVLASISPPPPDVPTPATGGSS